MGEARGVDKPHVVVSENLSNEASMVKPFMTVEKMCKSTTAVVSVARYQDTRGRACRGARSTRACGGRKRACG